jgi:peroxiredoxin
VRLAFALALVCLTLRAEDSAAPKIKPGREVPDFAMLDQKGRFHELRRTDAKVVMLYFTANGCPVARKTVPALKKLQEQFAEAGVRIWMVNSNPGDDRESIKEEAQEFKTGTLPTLLDETQGVAAVLNVRRTGTAVCIETTGWTVFYQGAVNDQYVEGAEKPVPTENFVAEALNNFLTGKPIEKPRTTAHGCLITIQNKPISYAKDVAPILHAKCFHCHSPGNIGPIKMTSYKKVAGVADMIQEVVLARRMPPWHADRRHGTFQNDFSLSVDEARTLLRWIEAGAQRDESPESDLLESAVPPSQGWRLGEPDTIVSLPKVEEIPATGIQEYRHIRVAAPFAEDVWVKGVVAKPDNARVVHHIIVRVREKGQKEDRQNDAFLIGWAPGSPEMYFPEGTGKRIKKGSTLEFEMHYTASGKPEKDQSRIGIYLHKEKPAMVLKTQAAYNLDFEISPGEGSESAAATYVFKKEGLLFDMSPHMHLRGSWFKFEALYPSGEREVLLSVPHYDFKWQHNYRLKEPKRMPAGTWILCSGGFDNSRQNPNNPNSKIPVHWGDQSFEEMFIGFMDVAEIPTQNPSKPLAAN